MRVTIGAKITPLGKQFRRIRLDYDLLLADFAERLGVSPAFVSAVEHGRRAAPTELIENVIREFDLDREEADRLRTMGAQTAREVRVPLMDLSADSRNLVLAFARKFPSLSEETRTKMSKLLEEEEPI